MMIECMSFPLHQYDLYHTRRNYPQLINMVSTLLFGVTP